MAPYTKLSIVIFKLYKVNIRCQYAFFTLPSRHSDEKRWNIIRLYENEYTILNYPHIKLWVDKQKWAGLNNSNENLTVYSNKEFDSQLEVFWNVTWLSYVTGILNSNNK